MCFGGSGRSARSSQLTASRASAASSTTSYEYKPEYRYMAIPTSLGNGALPQGKIVKRDVKGTSPMEYGDGSSLIGGLSSLAQNQSQGATVSGKGKNMRVNIPGGFSDQTYTIVRQESGKRVAKTVEANALNRTKVVDDGEVRKRARRARGAGAQGAAATSRINAGRGRAALRIDRAGISVNSGGSGINVPKG